MIDDVIVLSSSDDESEIIQAKKRKNTIPKDRRSNDSDFSLSDFPNVNFNDVGSNNYNRYSDLEKYSSFCNIPELDTSKKETTTDNIEEEDCGLSDFPANGTKHPTTIKIDEKDNSLGFTVTHATSSNFQNGSQSDSDCESQNNIDYWEKYKEGLKNKQNDPVDLSSDEDKWEEPEEKEQKNYKKKNNRKRAPTKSKAEALEIKKKKQEERQQEKLRKQEEAAKQKALKELNKKNRMQFKPDITLKSMEIVFDEDIQSHDYFADFLQNAEETEVQYNFTSQIIPKSITWNRKIENNYINERHEVCSNAKKINEDQIIIIWDVEETINHISNNTFISTISNLKSIVPNKKFTLVMYKIESYFKYFKSLKDRAVRDDILNKQGHQPNQKKSKTKADKTFAHMPKISREIFEECLVEIQLLFKVNTRLIEVPSEVALLIHQYTKSLAQRPSKMEKRQESSKFNWYVSSDNRDTVKVDKDGNGLKRLWQQQLCQFTLMSLETSEAIVSVYKSPLQLMEAYAKCTSVEGEGLLKDIPIRRAAGILTSTRKIGPELSRKIYTMFTAKDGDVYLNE